MSLKWYEQHVEEVVRQNEHLKFQLRKMQERWPSMLVVELFRGLFPDIPALDYEDVQSKNFEEILSYYRKVVDVWLQKEKTKIDYLLTAARNSPAKENSILSNSKSTLIIGKTPIERQRKCRRCDQDRSSKELEDKIAQLQKQIMQITEEMKQFQINQHKYLGQIALLRSITKKLEFQLSERTIVESKLKSTYALKTRNASEQIIQLRRQVDIWKNQYDRIWQEQQRVSSPTHKEQEITEMNTSRRMESQGSSSSKSNQWVIKSEQFQYSYTVGQH